MSAKSINWCSMTFEWCWNVSKYFRQIFFFEVYDIDYPWIKTNIVHQSLWQFCLDKSIFSVFLFVWIRRPGKWDDDKLLSDAKHKSFRYISFEKLFNRKHLYQILYQIFLLSWSIIQNSRLLCMKNIFLEK